MKKKLGLVFGVIALVSLTASLAHAAGEAVLQLPKLACEGSLAKINEDFENERGARIDIASKFINEHVEALKALNDSLSEKDRAAIRQLVEWGKGSAAKKKAVPGAIYDLHDLQPKLFEARKSFNDFSCKGVFADSDSSGCKDETNWKRTMESVVTINANSYGVQVCSQTFADGKYKRDLKLCSTLDLASGKIEGETETEALRLGKSDIERNAYVEKRVRAEQKCIEAAGYAVAKPATVNDLFGAKNIDPFDGDGPGVEMPSSGGSTHID